MDYAIETDNLTRRFGDLLAVDSLDLKIRKGEIFGFLGPNGAGKSTTIKMLTTLLTPSEGTAKVLGHNVLTEKNKVRSSVGVVPQQHSLYEDLTAWENLKLMGELYGMTQDQIRDRGEELVHLVSIWDRKNDLVKNFSGGMKQKLSLAASLVHEPEIVFMDEPTAGLDPQTRVTLRDLTKELNERGVTIVYCTHDMEEAEKICHRVGILSRGKLKAANTPEALKDMINATERIEIEVDEVWDGLIEELRVMEDIYNVEQNENRLLIQTSNNASLSKILDKISPHTEVRELERKQISLEDVFVHLTK